MTIRREGRPAVHIIPRDPTGELGPGEDIHFNDAVYSVTPIPGPNFDDTDVRLNYSSMVTPDIVYTYNVALRRLTPLKQMRVLDHPDLGAYDPEQYTQVREWAVADDGERIPVSVVMRRDRPQDGTGPLVLYGYGAYEFTVETRFDPMRVGLLDKGFAYAIAHVRGGGEMGRGWYEQGRQGQKLNTFRDFVAVARHLVDQG